MTGSPPGKVDVDFHAASGVLRVGAQQHQLRPRTAALLALLVGRADTLVEREELLQQVWPDAVVTDDSVTQCVKEIRRALGSRSDRLRTVPRRGYVWLAEQPASESDLATAHTAPAPAPAPVPALVPARARRTLLGVSLATAAGMAALTWAWQLRSGRRTLPIVVVLPFATTEASAAPGWLADALADELTDDLSRLPGLHVIARSSVEAWRAHSTDPHGAGRALGADHVIEGELRGDVESLEVKVRLLDGHDGRQRWTTQVSAPRSSLAGLQRELALRIARALEVELIEATLARVGEGRTELPRSHELTLQAWASLHRGSRDEVGRAQQLFDAALQLDDRNARAWLGLSHCHLTAYNLRWAADPQHELASAGAALARAEALAPRQLYVRGTAGVIHAVQGRLAEARELLTSELADHPNNAAAHYWLGIVRLWLAEPEAAAANLRRAIELSPHDKLASGFHRVLATALMHAGHADAALAPARQAIAFAPVHRLSYATLAAALQLNGQPLQAREAMAEFLRQQPGFTLRRLQGEAKAHGAAYVRQREALSRALLDAGLPP